MKRRWFWLFPASVAAQITDPAHTVTAKVVPLPDGELPACYKPQRCKPQNGECPVCGAMVEPWAPTVESYFPAGTCASRGSGNVVNSACFYPTKEDIPKSRTVICSNCRVHYEQERT